MRKLFLLFIVLFVGLQAQACRFTIREIGYSNLFLEQYRLVFYADASHHQELIKDFKSISYAYSLDGNVDFRFAPQKTGVPTILFLSGKGRELLRREVKSTDDIINCINSCFSSPLRSQVIDGIGKSFAFILYFEGEAGQGYDCDMAINKGVKHFKRISSHLDKAVNAEIGIIKIPWADRADEEVVLESLGVNAREKKPFVVPIYGRGRLAGKALMGEDITAQNIFKKLVVMGTDCECGIDLRPLLERALPLSWSKEVRQNAANMLKLDVDNPMIQVEMSGILAKGTGSNLRNETSFAYSKGALDKDIVELDHKAKDSENDSAIRTPFYRVILISIAFIILVLISGIIIYYRKR